MKKILFVDDNNLFASRVAELIVRKYYDFETFSCGVKVDRKVTDAESRALAEIGIDSLGYEPTHINEYAGQKFDYVVVFTKMAMKYAKMTIHPKPMFILVDEIIDNDLTKCYNARNKTIDSVEHLFDIGAIE